LKIYVQITSKTSISPNIASSIYLIATCPITPSLCPRSQNFYFPATVPVPLNFIWGISTVLFLTVTGGGFSKFNNAFHGFYRYGKKWDLRSHHSQVFVSCGTEQIVLLMLK
jgi:hypothetical protein